MKRIALCAIVLFASCKGLEGGMISVDLAGPVILDALSWGEASIIRDTALLEFEREQALASIAMAREILQKAK